MLTTDYRQTAHANILDQIGWHDGYGRCISLDAMWRHLGRPEGRDPVTWLKLAREMLIAYWAYHAALVTANEPEYGVTFDVNDPPFAPAEDWAYQVDDEPFTQRGDLLAYQAVAKLYAEYLDGPLGLDVLDEVIQLTGARSA